MIPVVTSSQMRAIDETAIEGKVTIGYSYMLKAGMGIRNIVRERITDPQSGEIAVFCGKGNNGGDGYVAARLLMEEGFRIMCFSLYNPEDLTGEAKIACEEYISSKGNVLVVNDTADLVDLRKYHLIIDAILGTGLRGDPRAHCALIIDQINKSGVPVIAVDIPSGLDADTGVPGTPTIVATDTITMGFPKPGFYFYPGKLLCGRLIIHELNYPDDCIAGRRLLLLPELTDLKRKLPARKPAGSKMDHGQALFVCGSRCYTGSAVLACEAALRTGCGMVHLCTPESILPVVASKLTETVLHPLHETGNGTISLNAAEQIKEYAKGKHALCIGPGISYEPQTISCVKTILRSVDVPVVLDADGINAFKDSADDLKSHAHELVITPHRGEWNRVFGPLPNEPAEVISLLKSKAKAFRCTILLKGNPTLVAEPGGIVYLLPFGNSALAKAGSGDVLSGIITSLVAQGASVTDSALLGAYIQGETATYLAREMTEYSVVARDIIEHLHKIMSVLVR
jgi:NAD(P)H-hydrate epimerase